MTQGLAYCCCCFKTENAFPPPMFEAPILQGHCFSRKDKNRNDSKNKVSYLCTATRG
jgi:hypothetical protein